MVFSSLTFLYFFLPINLLLYYIIKNIYYRNFILTLSSFIFYAWGEPLWILLLLFTSFFDYINGRLIEKFGKSLKSKWVLGISVFVNLGLLAAFKYSGFIYENISFFVTLPFPKPENTLPIGISFYTFQTISYVVDVYRGKVKAQRNPLNFLLFVSLFHQLVAGPIVRYEHIANEINGRKFKWEDFSSGVQRFCFGLFKKVMIANVAGSFVDIYLINHFSELTIYEAWFGIFMFAIQIYFDFSGYSDMAIGLGRMFGFHYLENFNTPYTATSATDFWRRWHISLGTFFRDYLYIPLGGNKKNMYLNLAIVWILTGVWHGASWNFIFWGAYFGLFIIIEKLFFLKVLSFVSRFFSHVYALFIVLMGWVIFYFTDLNQMGQFFGILFNFNNLEPISDLLFIELRENVFWLALTILLCMPWKVWLGYIKWQPTTGWVNFYRLNMIYINLGFLFISTIYLVGKSYNPFLYFRF